MMPDYYSILRSEIAPLLPANFAVVMDVGCGSGATLAWIRDRFSTTRLIGVEIEPSARAGACKICKEIHGFDIEKDEGELAQFAGQIDVLLLLDVLEIGRAHV